MNEKIAQTPVPIISVERVTLRPVTPEDGELLLQIYAAAREIELSMVPWDDDQKRAFLEHQLAAQTAYYITEFPGATHDVILLDNEPAGRLYIDRTGDQITILDLAVLSQFRNNGVASALVSELLNEGRPVGVCVETFNPSRDFFAKRGFEVISDDGANLRMQSTPSR